MSRSSLLNKRKNFSNKQFTSCKYFLFLPSKMWSFKQLCNYIIWMKLDTDESNNFLDKVHVEIVINSLINEKLKMIIEMLAINLIIHLF